MRRLLKEVKMFYRKSDMLSRIEDKESKAKYGGLKVALCSLAILGVTTSVIIRDKFYRKSIENLVYNAPVLTTEFTYPERGVYGFYSAEDCKQYQELWQLYQNRVEELNEFNRDRTINGGMIKLPDLDRDGSVGRVDTEKN